MKELETKLIQNNWITLEQLSLAQQEALRCGKSIWVALAKLGYLSDEDIAIFFAQESGIAYVKISDYKISPEILHLADEAFCRENLAIPLFKIKNILFIACSNPFDTTLLDNLMKMVNCDVEPLIATKHSILQALDYYWGVEDKTFALEKFIITQAPLQGVTFWRESERMPLDMPVAIKIDDAAISLNGSFSIEGYTRNISCGGTAVGLYIFLFLPKGTKVSLEFKPSAIISCASEPIKISGEVVYCHMEKGKWYFLGIKFSETNEEVKAQLIRLAETKKS